MKRLLHAVAMLAVLVGPCARGAVGQSQQREYEAKARFLTIAPGFVVWPPESFADAKGTLQLCVYGDFSFGIGLAELTQVTNVNGHRMSLKRVRKEKMQELQGCQIVFVSRSEAKRYDKVLDVVKQSNTLTVGEDAEFLAAGGMVNLQVNENGMVFDVNLDAVSAGRLKLSSQLLGLARHIVSRTETARS